MVLRRKLSRACAFIVSTDLCDELATVDHFAMTSLFVGSPVHLTTHKRSKGTQVLVWHCTLKAIHTSLLYGNTAHTCCPFSSSIQPTEVKSQMCHSSCLSVIIQLFIVQSNQHLPFSLSSDLPLSSCLHLPQGYDSRLSPDE